MLALTPSVQSPAAFDRANLHRGGLRTRLEDGGYRFRIHPNEVAAGLTDADLVFGHDVGEAERYGAVADGVADDTQAITMAVKCSKRVKLRGRHKITQAIGVNREHHIEGDGIVNTIVEAWGCGAFVIQGLDGDGINGQGVTIADLSIYAVDSDGNPDPRAESAILIAGTASETVAFFTGRRLYVQGFETAFDFEYTWLSALENVETVNCNRALRMFGQSVNISVANSRLVVNGGAESVLLEADGSTVGEGLMITGSLLASGTYGVRCTNGFLSLNINASIIDLIQDVAFKLVDCRKFSIGQSWVFAANKCVEAAPLSVEANVGMSIDGSHLRVAEDDGRCVDIGENNRGTTIHGGSMICGSGNSHLVYTEGNETVVAGVFGTNNGVLKSYQSGGGVGFRVRDCTGDASVGYDGGVPPRGELGAAAAFEGATGTPAMIRGCTVTRTAPGTYQVGFLDQLSSAGYVPMVLPRRTGVDGWTFELTAIDATGFTFVIRDESGAEFDPTDIYLTVHY